MIESNVSNEDKKFLKLALNLARRNLGLTGKNPSVGCVITCGDIIVGRGNTQPGGRPHAEIMAIKQASEHYLLKQTRKRKEVNVYVTHGVLNGKAVQKIKNSKIKRLVITDTINNSDRVKAAKNIEILTISQLVGEAIKRISNSTSVSDLFT